MNMNERVKQAKREIDSGAHDVHLHGKRLPVVLVDRSAGNFFGFRYKKQHQNRTFPEMAQAMAEQWSEKLTK